MNYISITVNVPEEGAQKDILIAALAELRTEGFEESPSSLIAFIPEADYDEAAFKSLLDAEGYSYTIDSVAQQNWNQQWEANFEPVILGDFCTIRAHFHDIPVTTKHDIIITPKMSFGTGHHDTTRLMMQAMEHIPMTGKSVFDFGTGTGVLAILAAQLGADRILAIDNDEWSYENAMENIRMNHCGHIEVKQDVIESYPNASFDIILANINRHILLAYMAQMYQLLEHGGILLMSGLLREDEQIVSDAAVSAGFSMDKVSAGGNWIAIKMYKK